MFFIGMQDEQIVDIDRNKINIYANYKLNNVFKCLEYHLTYSTHCVLDILKYYFKL